MQFPIVAVGASAGGIEALTELLPGLPAKAELAYVLIQHLHPEHESLLPELMAKHTAMPVVQIKDGEAVKPGHIFVIPPNTTLTLVDEKLRLSPRPSEGPHHPVDTFFASLARARGDGAIGVVLSGSNYDGTLGVEAIKHNGGITFAQEPGTARFPSMPVSAIETGCVDFVLRPSAIAEQLTHLATHSYLRGGVTLKIGEPSKGETEETIEADLERVFRQLRVAHGVDFKHYKRSTLRRRLARRMALRKIESLAEYVSVLEEDPTEVAALYQDFLIRVTGFFRDPETFEVLATRVFPALGEGRSPRDPIRVWVPGCATGEEVYSIAIALIESLGDRVPASSIQIFGTDVSEATIEKARAGYYPNAIEQELSAERLGRFFVKEDSHYRISKNIRDMCIFARQDVTRDPPFSRLDLVSCRNLLIYLDASVQRRVMQIFHYALRSSGFLMLGTSESVGSATDMFDLLDKHHRIYVRKPAAGRASLDLGIGTTTYGRTRDGANAELPIPETDTAQREADRLLLAQYAPASLLIDEGLDILQVRGETSPYLELAAGPPTFNLRRVARQELLVEISPALAEARETGSTARREGLIVGSLTNVILQVIPLRASSGTRCYLIVLEDATRSGGGRRPQPGATPALTESEKDRRIAQLERENASTRDYLQATMEEHEAVKEELKSAHEEVLSANEEFQSTNEELETAKEELQSANEELSTTNDELRNRNRELSVLNAELQRAREVSERARAYADAIVESIHAPLVVLGLDLRILRANRAFYAAYKVRRAAIEGNLLTEIDASEWNLPPLLEQLRAVAQQNVVLDNFDITHSSEQFGRRTLRLNARKIPSDAERNELILVAIEDVTERRIHAEQLQDATRRKDEFLAMLAHELRNPLTPIAHTIHLLEQRSCKVHSAKHFKLIERQTSRLVHLVDELLDVARINRGHVELKREVVDLTEIARHAVDASRARLEERNHEIRVSLPANPVFVRGDSLRLEQVVSNLLENAGKYTEPGGRIQLSLTEDKDEASLCVRDNGIGLAPENLEKIFELFAQVNGSLSRSSGGLGIGLTLVRQVLELHGGRIEARSAGLGHGAEFIVKLPTVPAKKPSARARVKMRAGEVAARRVLIVDDSEEVTESMASLVRSWGHEVAIARDGPSALALAKKFKPERALVDIGLPGMTGFELGRRLRDALPRLYLIAVSGYGSSDKRKTALSDGFDAYLVKPADLEELEGLLARGATKRKRD